jgi:hypothetical protein
MHGVLEAGDILLVDPQSDVSNFLKQWTGRDYTHSALYIGRTGQTNWGLLDSGAKFGPDSIHVKDVRRYSNLEYEVWRPDLTSYERRDAATKAYKLRGHEYNVTAFYHTALYYVTGVSIPYPGRDDKFNCADMVNYGYDNMFGNPGKVHPWSFKESELTKLVLKHDA